MITLICSISVTQITAMFCNDQHVLQPKYDMKNREQDENDKCAMSQMKKLSLVQW